MDQIKLEELAVAYPDQEDLVQVYKEWGDSAYLQELFKVLDSYEPDWNKEKELGSWAAEFAGYPGRRRVGGDDSGRKDRPF